MHILMDNGDLVHDSQLKEYLRAHIADEDDLGLTKKELANWVLTGDPYTRMIPSPLSSLHGRIVQALIIQEKDE